MLAGGSDMRNWVAVSIALSLAAASVCSAAEDFERTVNADPQGQVRVSNVSGLVSVTGWDRPQVEVKGRLSGDVERVDVFSDKGRTTIKVVLPKRSIMDGDAELEIRVPEGSDLDVSAVSADVTTLRLTGPQRLTTVSGNIRADFARDFEGKTVSGDMRLKGNSQPGGLRLSTVSGDVTLERGAGELEATTVSGDLVLEVLSARTVRTRTTSGDLLLRGSLTDDANVEAETISGEIAVRMKPQAGFEYEVSSFSGDIGNCFGRQAESANRHGPGMRLNGSTGEGKARLRVKSMSGDVALCDR
jgi:DUF4097 and DUF4098 domain-containing protein YvlB